MAQSDNNKRMKVSISTRSVSRAIAKVSKKLATSVNREIASAAKRTVGVAKNRLQPYPWEEGDVVSDIVSVRQSINFIQDKDNFSASVFAGNTSKDDMAAYLEFGTGPYAERYLRGVEKEWQDLAWSFYVNGEGTLPEHPYLRPAYKQESKRLADRLVNLKVDWS